MKDLYIVIVPGTSLSGELLSSTCCSSYRVGLLPSVPRKWPPTMVLIQKLAYTDIVRPEKELMMLQRHRVLLNYLGNVGYKAHLPRLVEKVAVVHEEEYCVICPGASKKEKCWPIERFVEVIDFIVEKYDMNIHLCGSNEEKLFETVILNSVSEPSRIVSHIGTTTFEDWLAIVQHASLVVGNDSATMHLAAACNRKAICISGVYDKYQFFPYKVDVLREGERLPYTIYKNMPCEWCRTMGYYAGYGNKECKERIKNDRCANCIDDIKVIEIIEQIQIIMEEEKEYDKKITQC